MELVFLVCLVDVKLGLPVRQSSSAIALALTGVIVEVVKKPEEGSEGDIGVVEVSRE